MSDNTLQTFYDLRQRFHDEANKAYPQTGDPEMCWLFDQALGIDPRHVTAEPITKKTYKVFILDERGKRVTDPKTHEFYRITRKFDRAQQRTVAEWWPLLPDRMKAA
jgi:hypothetical protein